MLYKNFQHMRQFDFDQNIWRSLSPGILQLASLATWIAFGALLVSTTITFWVYPRYSPDSWAYYELANSVLGGSYHLEQLRSFQSPPGAASTSFPPAFPALWAVTESLTGTGARAGLLINLVLVGVIAVQTEYAVRRLSGARGIGLVLASLLFASPGFFDEVVAARSIPLTVALVLQSFIWLSRADGPRPFEAALAGLAIGLSALTRFDMLPFGCCVVVFVLALRPHFRIVIAFFPASPSFGGRGFSCRCASMVVSSQTIIAGSLYRRIPWLMSPTGIPRRLRRLTRFRRLLRG